MINAISFTRMLQLLMDGPVTKTNIAEETGLHHVCVANYVRHMHAKRVIRIEEYRRCAAGRVWVPHYALNPDGLPDARKPAPTPGAARSAAYRRKKAAMKLNQMMAGTS